MLRRLTAAAVLVCCLAPASALGSADTVIKDCTTNGRLTKKYTQKEYQSAIANLPTDVDEYTDCRDIIRNAELTAGSGSGSKGGGGGGGTTGGTGGGGTAAAPVPATGPIRDPYQGAGATPAETAEAQKDVAAATHAGAAPLPVANTDVRPGALAYHNFGSVSKLPTPLVVLAILVIAAALGVSVYLIRNRVRTGQLRT